MKLIEIGIIGYSWLYCMANLQNTSDITLDTPFGKSSDNIITTVIALPRYIPRP